MNFKRNISAMLALSMLFAASCGGQAGSSETTSGPESSDAATVAEKAEYEKPDVDYGGKTVTYIAHQWSSSWVINSYKLDSDEENGDQINDAIVKRNRAVEEALKIKLEVLPLTEMSDRDSPTNFNKYALSGEDMFSFAILMSGVLPSLVTTEGMFTDLNSIPTLDLSHSWWNQAANEEYTIYGKQQIAVGDICYFNNGAPVVVYFSRELVEKNKFENPYEIVNSGKWTLEKMLKMAYDATSDLNGNDTIDTEDQFGLAAESASLGYILECAGDRLTGRDKNGNITITVNNEKTPALCELFINATKDPRTVILDGTVKTALKTSFSSNFTEFFVPKMMTDELLFFTNQLHVALNLRAMQTEFGILPMPKYDEAQEKYYSFGNAAFSDCLAVPGTCSDLEMTGNVIEAMGYYSQKYITPAFINTTVMDKAVRDEESAKIVQMVLENRVYDIGFIFNWGKIRSVFNTMVNNADPNFASNYASIENNIKAEMEKTMEMLR